MITAVDTNVLLDVLLPDNEHGRGSRERLRDASDAGEVVICEVVYAELVPSFPNRESLDLTLQNFDILLSPIDSAVAYDAGRRWKRYRDAGGPRKRIMTDFLIGAHAVARADAFLTRDRGFFATYFPELGIGEVV